MKLKLLSLRGHPAMGKDGMESPDVEAASQTCADDLESIHCSALGVKVSAAGRKVSILCETPLNDGHCDVTEDKPSEEVKCVAKGIRHGGSIPETSEAWGGTLGLSSDERCVDADSGLSPLDTPGVTAGDAAAAKLGEIPPDPPLSKRASLREANMDATPTQDVPAIVVTGEISPPYPYSSKELKSVLKKERSSSKRGRVTFDEAVTLYSDDNPEVQVLALRTADISYADVFYMFEPPLEYQDLLPFEPPAEYRDPDTSTQELVVSEIPAEEPPEVALETTTVDCKEDKEEEDEELNSLFQAFDEELAGEGKNGGELDDAFFKKLLQLLSSLEGEGPFQDSDLFSSTDFCEESNDDSRSVHEGDSDCSASSQDTIVVKASDDSDRNESVQGSQESIPREDPDILKEAKDVQDLSRQSSDDRESVTGGAPFRKQNSKEDGVHETDDSTSSDSRSGEVEEDCRQDDIGYDEEDAEDYEDESLKGMSNSRIRRIIKKNALQCTLLRGIEARRRQTGKYSRPKSPLPSKDSLVEQLRWLTTVDENKEQDSVPAIPLFSKGRLNGVQSMSTSSEEESSLMDRPSLIRNYAPPRPPLQHPMNYVPVMRNPPVIRRWAAPDLIRQQPQRVVARVSVPGRDWRVIQRVVVNRQGLEEQVMKGAFRSSYPPQAQQPTMAQRVDREIEMLQRSFPRHDELEQFVNRDMDRMERIRQRYSLAEDDDDPTFGFAQRPAVRGIRNRFGTVSTEILEQLHTTVSSTVVPNPRVGPPPDVVYAKPPPQQPPLRSAPPGRTMNQWNHPVIYRAPFSGQAPHAPYDVHRASVAVAEMPKNALTDGHYYPTVDPRYHSFVENTSRSSFAQDPWVSAPRRSSLVQISVSPNMPPKITVPALPSSSLPPPPSIPLPCPPVPTVSHQAPSTQMSQNLIYSVITKDERGTPEGASSSPKVSQDSLYHGHEKSQPTDPTTKDGVIYYSLNV